MTRRDKRLIWIHIALCVITGTAMIGGAFAHIAWLFWGIGLPAAIVTLIYTYLAAGFAVRWAQEKRDT